MPGKRSTGIDEEDLQSHAIFTFSDPCAAPQNLLPVGAAGYELVSKIKTGGMADVYLARRIGRAGVQSVVVKRLRDEILGDPAIARMFAWEAWITSRLCHQNIVHFYDFTHFQGCDYLVLEHVSGADLGAIFRSACAAGEPVSFDAVLDTGIGIARALDCAHRLADDQGRLIGLVHRDVSPQNILISTSGEVKLIDFGVAKTTSVHVPRDTAKGLKGKVGYLTPEQVRGQPVDARSDVYALGIVLFEMIAGRRLFRRSRDVDTLRAVLNPEIPLLGELRPDCPEALSRLVHRALEANPADRFESAFAMGRALSAIRARTGEAAEGEALARLVSGLSAPPPPSSPATATREGPPPSTSGTAASHELGQEPCETLREGALSRSRLHDKSGFL
jgi:serine/threonine-protein kinase